MVGSEPHATPSTATDRAWLLGAALVACTAVAARLHNAHAYPPLGGFDAQGHALNAFAFFEGRLPHLRSWSGFHPPAYYALGAALWRALPEAVPVHATLRLVSTASALLMSWIVWRVLRRFVPAVDAAIAAVLTLCVPVAALSASMIGNEMMGACVITAVLARLTAIPFPTGRTGRHALGTGLLAGVALLTKSTGLIALGAATLHYAMRLRHQPRSLFAALAIVALTPVLVAGPHYARLVSATGSLRSVVTAAEASPDVRAAMEEQPPGERRLRDYVSLPASTFLAPVYVAPGMTSSVPGLLYASTWADAHGHFFTTDAPLVLRAQSLLTLLGLLPTALVLLGLARILRRPRRHAAWFGPGVFAAAILVSLLGYSWSLPYYSAVKASYLLPAALPAAYALCVGLGALPRRALGLLRLALLLLAAVATGLTWYGWWL